MKPMENPVPIRTFVSGQANAARQELLGALCRTHPVVSYQFVPGTPSGFVVRVGGAGPMLLVGSQVEAWAVAIRQAFAAGSGLPVPDTKMVAEHQFD
jgi:hypothetical protein